jgi:hypothetical protein
MPDESKKSLAFGIFLKRNPADLVVEEIKSGHAKRISPDSLLELVKLIPDQDEVNLQYMLDCLMKYDTRKNL